MDVWSTMKGVRSRGEVMIIGVINKTMANPAMTRLTVKAMEATLPVKAVVGKNLQFVYKSMDLPSRADFHSLAAKVSRLSRKQEALDKKIEMLCMKIDKISEDAGENKT